MSLSKGELSEVSSEIRSINLQIKEYARTNAKVTIMNLDGTESEVDPIPDLENKKHLCMQRYEQLNEGKSHKFTSEEKIEDFLIMLFRELERKERSIEWMGKFYHPDATMTWIDGITQTRFEKKENIVDSYLRRYEGLKVSHQFRAVQVDAHPTLPNAVMAGNITIAVTIESDKPRIVKYMMEWTRAVESGLFDVCIAKELFWIADARPLYHWPEKLLPHEIRALQEAEELKKRKELEALQEEARLAAEELKRRKEAGEVVSDDDEEEDEGEDEEEEEEVQDSASLEKENDEGADG